jgi:O-antigen ligase
MSANNADRQAGTVCPASTADLALESFQQSALHRIGFAIILMFLFIAYSRVFDVKFSSLHIPGLMLYLSVFTILITGAFGIAFKARLTKLMFGLTVCIVLSIPFSVWRLGSLRILTGGWINQVFLFIGLASMLASVRDCRKAISAIAWGVLVISLLALRIGESDNGRLFMSQGKFSNPNDLAQAILFGLPGWWLIIKRSRSPVMRLVAFASVVVIMMTFTKTASRGGFTGLVVLILVYFWRSSSSGKVKIAFVMTLTMVAALLLVPKSIKARLTTLSSEDLQVEWTDPEYTAGLRSAVASTQSRKVMLWRSLILTARHPFFGVGAGMFPTAENDYARSLGERKGSWLGTHNSYTQISSEIGIPGLILYLTILITCLKESRRVYKVTAGNLQFAEIGDMAICLNYMVLSFMITALFSSVAFMNFVPILAGLTASFLRAIRAKVPERPLPVTFAYPPARAERWILHLAPVTAAPPA